MEVQACAVPFRHWIVDDFFQPCKLEDIPDNDWPHWEVSYDNDVEKGKKTSRSFSDMPDALRTAFIKLRHPDTVAEWSKIAGIPSLQDDPIAWGAGLHKSWNGSYLQCHVDYEVHPKLEEHERRLSMLLYMHPGWKDSWGGHLQLCDPWGNVVVSIMPKPGRLAVFECGPFSYHSVRPINGAYCPRLSCAVYYLADRRPEAHRRRALYFPNRNPGGVPKETLP